MPCDFDKPVSCAIRIIRLEVSGAGSVFAESNRVTGK